MSGLRERKKRQTRATIAREALRLFRKKGFESTTIADIAAAADIAPRTFFGYFETKEAVVFHDFDEAVAGLSAKLEEREAGETAFDALRAWVEGWVATRDVTSRAERARQELIRTTPALRAREHAHRGAFERLIAEHVAADLGVPADSLRPQMVGAAAVAALSALEERGAPEAGEDPLAVLDEAMVFLQGGLRALRSARA